MRYFIGDFETTTYEGIERTEVWASAVVEFGSEDVHIHHSLYDTYKYLINLKDNIIIYYHNLKFDGEFWISFLEYEQGYEKSLEYDEKDYRWKSVKDMRNHEYQVCISELGQWYFIKIKKNNRIIEIRDSLKILPFTVEQIGKYFETKHQKLTMVYEGYRYAGCEITDTERRYIANDVLVVKEAMELMFAEGDTRLTIGSCCHHEFTKMWGDEYDTYFPDLREFTIDRNIFGDDDAWHYINRSYHGGWSYVVPGKECKIYHNGITVDANSLYPSQMMSESGNRYPVGKPVFWCGDIPEEACINNRYYFVRIRGRFAIKEDHLPFIQIKKSLLYNGREMLTTSDVNIKGKYYRYDDDGNEIRPILTMTMTDYALFQDQYDSDYEILDGCYFETESNIFDLYLDKYRKIKVTSTGGKRTRAKLKSNNEYGKQAANDNSSFKIPMQSDDGVIHYYMQAEHDKTPGYIAIGSAITSYARNQTIRKAQANYHGVDKPGFIYSDTDSLHLDIPEDELVDVPLDDNAYQYWKVEERWDTAWFVRSKVYIEITGEKYLIKCAGLPKNCKELLEHSIKGTEPENFDELPDDQKAFIRTKRTIEDFRPGIDIPGKLKPHRIPGGVVLQTENFKMKKH